MIGEMRHLLFALLLASASGSCGLVSQDRLDRVRADYAVARPILTIGAGLLPPGQSAALLRGLELVQQALDSGGAPDTRAIEALGGTALDAMVKAGKITPEQGEAAKALLRLLIQDLAQAASRPASQPAR
jgi:hypothetical protein